MILKPTLYFQRQQALNIAGTAGVSHPLLGTSVPNLPLKRDLPIEELIVRVKCQVSNATLTLNQTSLNPESIMGIVKRIKIFRPANSQGQAGTVVCDFRGLGLLEYIANEGFNHTDATLGAQILAQGTTVAANQLFTIDYRIPFVHPKIAEPLRSRCLFPVHTFTEDPTIQIDFESAANLYTTATTGVIQGISVELVYVRRKKNDKQTANIMASGGYIPMDLIEVANAIAPGTSGEQSLNVPLSGSLLSMGFSLYQGGTNIFRGVPDSSTAFGAESTILIKVNGDTWDTFTWDQLKTINALSRPRNSHLQATSPALGLPVYAGQSFSAPASVMREYLSDGVGSDGDSAYELGSVLSLDAVKASGGKVEVVLTPATNGGGTYGHQVFMQMRRLWGDLTTYQALEKVAAASGSGN